MGAGISAMGVSLADERTRQVLKREGSVLIPALETASDDDGIRGIEHERGVAVHVRYVRCSLCSPHVELESRDVAEGLARGSDNRPQRCHPARPTTSQSRRRGFSAR